MTNIQRLHVLTSSLVERGADERELQIWKEIYPTLDADLQEKLIAQLEAQKLAMEKSTS